MRYMLSLAWRRLEASPASSSWSLTFQTRSIAMQRHVRLRQQESLGTIALQLSAVEIQRYWRRHAVRVRRRLGGRARARARDTAGRLAGAPGAPARRARGASGSPSHLEIDLVSKFLDAKQATRDTERRGALTYRDWCASRIQAWWRMRPLRRAWLARRWAVFFVAARSVQRWWLDHLLAQVTALRGLGDNPRHAAARRIQRCWRGMSSKRVMVYFVNLIKFREQGNPARLLRSVNPREAGLLDAATGAHVRFRLGGLDWPPKVYYKIYTHAAVTDICAYAPRDYTRAKQLPPRKLHNKPPPGERRAAETREGWYSRVENNGWRPVQESLLRELDHVTVSTSAKPVSFAPTRMQRREDVLQRRRQKKLAWLQAMYLNRGAAHTSGAGAAAAGADDGADGHDVDALLQWTDELDFDGYYNNWLTLATTGRAKPAGISNLEDLEDSLFEADAAGAAGAYAAYEHEDGEGWPGEPLSAGR